MGWFRAKPNPQLELARSELAAALPAGWRLVDTDRERFRLEWAELTTWGALAEGPDGELLAAVAVPDEAAALRALAARFRGALAPAPAWAPPPPAADPTLTRPRSGRRPGSAAVEGRALAAADAALPAGWQLFGIDRERYGPGGPLQAHAAIATGPDRSARVAIALSEAEALHGLAELLRGTLPASEAWAPPD